LNITVDTTYLQSAFKPKSDQEVNQIISDLNAAKAYYQSIGFKKVFLTVIPNAVSIYDDKRMPYNHLLERVESHVNLKQISMYKIYKTSDENLYYKNDAHWNPKGLDIWVQETNKILQSNLR
jgi:hypothetical protein